MKQNNSVLWIVPISLSLSLLMFTLASVDLSSIAYYPGNAFQYFYSLPSSYFVGFIITISSILIATLKNCLSEKVKLGLVIILMLYLFGIPALTYENARHSDVYLHMADAMAVQNTHSYTNPQHDRMIKESPGSYVAYAIILAVTDIDPTILMKGYQIFLMFMVTILAYIIAKEISGRYAVLAPFSFLSLAWFGELHLSRQSYSLMLYFLLWFILFKILISSRLRGRAWVAIFYPLSFAIVASHPGTPIFIILNLLFISIFFFFSNSEGVELKKVQHLLLSFIVVYLAWTLFQAFSAIGDITTYLYNSVLTASFSPTELTYTTMQPNYEYSIAIKTRLAAGAFQMTTGLMILVMLFRKNTRDRKTVIILGGWFTSVLTWGATSIYHGGTYLQRPLLFATMPWAILIAFFCKTYLTSNKQSKTKNRTIIITTLLISGVIFFSSSMPIMRYASEPFLYMPTYSIEGAKFVVQNLNDKVLVMDNNPKHFNFLSVDLKSHYSRYNKLDEIINMPPKVISFSDRLYNSETLRGEDMPKIPAITSHYYIPKKDLLEENYYINHYNRIYDNKGFRIFIKP